MCIEGIPGGGSSFSSAQEHALASLHLSPRFFWFYARHVRRYASGMGIDNDYFVGWGTLALINAGLAKSMRRSSGAWFLASVFLGPIATFLLVITDSPKEKATP